MRIRKSEENELRMLRQEFVIGIATGIIAAIFIRAHFGAVIHINYGDFEVYFYFFGSAVALQPADFRA